MFKNIEQQLHQSFVTALSMELSPWSWATILPTPASTIGFTDIHIETLMRILATLTFSPINWVMSPTENTSETALAQGCILKFRSPYYQLVLLV